MLQCYLTLIRLTIFNCDLEVIKIIIWNYKKQKNKYTESINDSKKKYENRQFIVIVFLNI